MIDYLPIGTRILSVHGECSDDENGDFRRTGENAAGTITSADQLPGGWWNYGIIFPGGVHVFLDSGQLSDPTSYQILPAGTVSPVREQAKSNVRDHDDGPIVYIYLSASRRLALFPEGGATLELFVNGPGWILADDAEWDERAACERAREMITAYLEKIP